MSKDKPIPRKPFDLRERLFDIQRLIGQELSRSPTFRRLLSELNASDVIVHVAHHTMPDGFRGYLVHRVIELD